MPAKLHIVVLNALNKLHKRRRIPMAIRSCSSGTMFRSLNPAPPFKMFKTHKIPARCLARQQVTAIWKLAGKSGQRSSSTTAAPLAAGPRHLRGSTLANRRRMYRPIGGSSSLTTPADFWTRGGQRVPRGSGGGRLICSVAIVSARLPTAIAPDFCGTSKAGSSLPFRSAWRSSKLPVADDRCFNVETIVPAS